MYGPKLAFLCTVESQFERKYSSVHVYILIPDPVRWSVIYDQASADPARTDCSLPG